jgi:hypothetical protein
MELQKSTSSSSLNMENDVKLYIEKKKEENLALKKLLTALEDAKKKRIEK